jgi:glycosyltransferase involved in cell wall biosynthesis
MLSIIIPTLNEEKYLPRLIASIKKQSFSDYEIIVSDGNSQDNTKSIALENNCKFVINTEHRSPSWQRNIGAELAQGEILLFLDADTVLQDGFLEKVVTEFSARGLCGAGFYYKFNPDKFSYKIFSFLYNITSYLRQYSLPVAIGAGIMSKKETHDLIKGFNTEIILGEDSDYCYRLSHQGKFRMIKSLHLLYSSRRIEKEGWLRMALKWGYMDLLTLLGRKIKGLPIKYDFGKF